MIEKIIGLQILGALALIATIVFLSVVDENLDLVEKTLVYGVFLLLLSAMITMGYMLVVQL